MLGMDQAMIPGAPGVAAIRSHCAGSKISRNAFARFWSPITNQVLGAFKRVFIFVVVVYEFVVVANRYPVRLSLKAS
jgi:hypothetical protein